jgi:hypothetical protein
MNTHPYLRAYIAGVFVPTLVMPLLLLVFIVARVMMQLPIPIEQAMIFPMAIVPSLFGLWNMLWQALHRRTSTPIGLHGAVLPLVMAPLGAETACHLGVLQLEASGVVWFHALHVPYALIAAIFVAGLIVYYLVWKYIVGFMNRELGIA